MAESPKDGEEPFEGLPQGDPKDETSGGKASKQSPSKKPPSGGKGSDAAEAESGKPKGDRKPRWWHDRRKLGAVIAAILILGGIGVAIAYNQLKRPDDVHNTDVPFKPPPKPPKPVVKTTDWPMFGFDRARTRFLPAKGIKPPFKKLWKYGDRPLIEFPPIVVKNRLYFVDNNGHAVSLNSNTGKIQWKRRIATLNAASFAYSKGRLFITNLEPGQAIALNAKNGKTIWKKALPGRSESSPLVIGNTVYFGCECGQLFAVSARNGNTRWATTLGGAIKAAPAYDKGVLFVGDYGGVMSAVKAKTGQIKWQSDSLGGGLGSVGAFYAPPAVAFGRVYSGNNDSRVYSFDEKTGELAWSYSTGSYVYSGTAVADTKHIGPTVYVGSIDQSIYALNAENGSLRWQRSAGGPGIGSLSIIGNIVYIATFEGTTISGFSLKSGKRVFRYPTGAYFPAISDGRRLYIVGYSSIHALQPVKKGAAKGGNGKSKNGGSKGGQGGKPAARGGQKGAAGSQKELYGPPREGPPPPIPPPGRPGLASA